MGLKFNFIKPFLLWTICFGSAQIFPSDLLVGKIVKVINNKFYVLPFVDFNNIDYVQIVKSK